MLHKINTVKGEELYKLSHFRDGRNYCLEIQTPFDNHFYAFVTFGAYNEYLRNFTWQLKKNNQVYEWEEEKNG